MDTQGKAKIPLGIRILPESRDRMREKVKRWHQEGKTVRISFSGEAVISGLEKDGFILLEDIEGNPADVHIETWYKRGSITQKNTLRALEALLYWADYNVYPPNSKLLWGYHQGIIHNAGIVKEDPVSQTRQLVSTSSPLCTTTDMNRFISVAVDYLLGREIPPNMIEPLSKMNFRELFYSWYAGISVDEALYDSIHSWDEYRQVFPFDEFHVVGVREKGTGQTQKIHIVSRGSDKADIEEPWNWIHGDTRIHKKIHDVGWGPVLQEFTHIVPKVKRARAIAGKKNLI